MIKFTKTFILYFILGSSTASAQCVISSAYSPNFVLGETIVGTSATTGPMLTHGFLQGTIEVISSGINDAVNNQFNLKWNLYPNPIKSILNISCIGNNSIENSELKIYSIQGALVYNTTLSSQESQAIDLSMLSAGVYNILIVDTTNNYTIQSTKIIKY